MTEQLTLTSIVDEVNTNRLWGKPHCCGRRVKLSSFITKRQGVPGSYCNLFAPTDEELADGYRFFTGERISTNAGMRHILGEEALRALVIMAPRTKSGKAAIDRAAEAMSQRLYESETQHGGGLRDRGLYCCMRCSVALWRVYSVGVIDDAQQRLTCGLKILKSKRNDQHDWQSFPFYYTLSALIDMQHELADKELKFALPAIEKRYNRSAQNSDDVYIQRRKKIMELAMQRVG